jgi:hypothetical protein
MYTLKPPLQLGLAHAFFKDMVPQTIGLFSIPKSPPTTVKMASKFHVLHWDGVIYSTGTQPMFLIYLLRASPMVLSM